MYLKIIIDQPFFVGKVPAHLIFHQFPSMPLPVKPLNIP